MGSFRGNALLIPARERPAEGVLLLLARRVIIWLRFAKTESARAEAAAMTRAGEQVVAGL